MGIITWIIFGGLAGWAAGKMTDNKSMGLIGNIIVGIVGSSIGGFLMSLIGGEGVTGFNIWSFLVAVLGSIVLLWIVNLFTGKKE